MLGSFFLGTDVLELTHYKLDACGKMVENMRMKRRGAMWVCMLLLLLAGIGCKPQGTNIDKLTELQRRNAALRQEIAEMKNLIRRAGEDDPQLQDQIERRNKEVAQAYETLKALKAQETEVSMRRIELEDRLDSFRETFRELQDRVISSVRSAP